MSYDPWRVTLLAELSVVTDHRPQEIPESTFVFVGSSPDPEPPNDQYGIPDSTHRCLTFQR